MNESEAAVTIDIDTLRQRLETTRARIEEWLFLCRSFDRALGRVACDEALLVVFVVRLRQLGVHSSVVSRAIAELLQRPGDALADDWIAVKRQREKDIEFVHRDIVDLTALRRDATAKLLTAAEMRALIAG